MTEREKIINIVEQNKYCDINTVPNCEKCKYSKELENYKDMGCSSLKTADALIAAGIGDVESWKISDADKEQSSINYYCEMREWKDKCKEAEHRAEVAERALLTACVNLLKDEEGNVNMELLVRVVYTHYLRNAEKELAEE